MLPHADAQGRAFAAAVDAIDLLGMAGAALHRAQGELDGEALELAERLALHVGFMREVLELLCHEIRRPPPPAPRLAPIIRG